MISQKIIQIRKEKRVSEKDLARGIEMSITGLRQAMAHDDFKISTIKKIATYLDTDLKYFFDDNIPVFQTNSYASQIPTPNVLFENELKQRNFVQGTVEVESIIQQKNALIEDLKFTIESLKSSINSQKKVIEILERKY
ncbi:MAG: hypothetical protein LBV69_11410 [Bacteroidales bacterium]|jgi:transcriptional regulator with XRE-family HTH domain|nr:hypothetical protein [Bacteroidales bacterium]